jgi:hypothetical protein
MTSVLVVYRDGVLVPEADLALLEDGTSFVVQIPEASASPVSAADALSATGSAAGTDELEFFHWLDGKWGTLTSEESQRIIDNDERLAWNLSQSRAASTWLL